MPDLLILAVADLERAVTFYRAALGLTPSVGSPAYVEMAEGIGLYQRDGFARNIGESPAAVVGISGTELYFRVADVDTASRRITAAGGRLLSPASSRPWGEIVAYHADPDGNVIAIAQRVSS
jgi:predicted enzyme related to lactoylglutathione lyase